MASIFRPLVGDVDHLNQSQIDDFWLRCITHGRGLDTLPDEIKREIQTRFKPYGTAGLFPNVPADRVSCEATLCLGENLTMSTA